MTIAIVTPAYTTHEEEWSVLRESAALCGATLHVIGGEGYNPLKSITDISDYVRQLDTEYVVATDAYDTMMCRWAPEEVVALVNASINGLVVSCEVSCYPAGPWGTTYGTPATPWWYPNAGQMVGTKIAMLQLWQEYLSGKWPIECGGGTQEMLHRMYANGSVSGERFGRDVRCAIFQSMCGHESASVMCEGGVVTNTVTRTQPQFLHWNGRSGGMREFYERWRSRA